MKNKIVSLAAVAALALSVGAFSAGTASAGSIKTCEGSGPFIETQKGSCNSSHEPVCTNPGGQVNEDSRHCR